MLYIAVIYVRSYILTMLYINDALLFLYIEEATPIFHNVTNLYVQEFHISYFYFADFIHLRHRLSICILWLYRMLMHCVWQRFTTVLIDDHRSRLCSEAVIYQWYSFIPWRTNIANICIVSRYNLIM